MTDYYGKRMQSFTYLENMIRRREEGIEKEILVYEIETKFGFSQKFVEKRLALLEKVGKIKIEMGVVQWL